MKFLGQRRRLFAASSQRRAPIVYTVFGAEDIRCSSCRYVAKSPNNVENGLYWGPSIFRGRDTPTFEHAFSNRTHFRTRGRFWLSSIQ